MPTAIPLTLDTERLVLRQLAAGDETALHELYGDAECTRFTFGKPMSAAGTWHTLAGMIGHWQLRGWGPYALQARDGGLLGVAGPWYPPDWPEPEIKWALARRHWGQGFASEAVRALQAMLAAAWPGRPPISFIDAQNSASIRLALAVGARFEREVQYRGGPWHIYRHPAQPNTSTRFR